MTGHTDLTTRARQLADVESRRLRNILMVPGCSICQMAGKRCGSHPDPLTVEPWPTLLQLCDALDATTNPDLATLLMKNADNYDKRFGYETLMGEQMRAAARIIGGNT